ncbi:unnamed protein product [Effrenium voratum]|nr:unnamed protein product [Effrenium voratum]
MARHGCALLPLALLGVLAQDDQDFRASVRLSSPHCSNVGISFHDALHDWRAFAKSSLQCQRSCAESPSCKFFNFYPDSGDCFLSAKEGKLRKERAVSGPKECPARLGSEPANGTEPLLFILGAADFNGPGELFEDAMQAAQFAARRAAKNTTSMQAGFAAAGVARSLAKTASMGPVQQEIAGAAAAAAEAAAAARGRGQDLRSQALAASTAAQGVVNLPEHQKAALQCLGAAFAAAEEAGASKQAVQEAAAGAAYQAVSATGWNHTQRQEVLSQVAGLSAALHAKAQGLDLQKQRDAARNVLAAGAAPKRLAKEIDTAMATELKVRNIVSKDPAAANLVWVGDGFMKAFEAARVRQPSQAALQAAAFRAAMPPKKLKKLGLKKKRAKQITKEPEEAADDPTREQAPKPSEPVPEPEPEAEDAPKVDRKGVIHLASIPLCMGIQKLRHIMEQFGEVGRVYLAPEDKVRHQNRKRSGGSRKVRFTEGWVEFADRRVARRVAESLNGSTIGGKKRHNFFRDDMWNMRYLPGFKWHMLKEGTIYNQQVRKARLQQRMSQATRENSFYLESVEKAKTREKIAERRAARGKNGDEGAPPPPPRMALPRREAKSGAPSATRSAGPGAISDRVLSKLL